jgi:uncharacterized protein YdeI (YjbR/CyaY-like superfamily)
VEPPAEHRGRPVVVARSVGEWRQWLADHGDASPAVWLTVWKQSTDPELLRYDDVIDEALCWGWIDSTVNRWDDDCYLLLVARRKPGSVWSAPNKARVARLVAEGRMRPGGLAAVERAQADGSWSRFDAVEALEEPDDLRRCLDADPSLRAAWDATTPGRRKQVLGSLELARTATTRNRRLEQALAALAEGRPQT